MRYRIEFGNGLRDHLLIARYVRAASAQDAVEWTKRWLGQASAHVKFRVTPDE